MTVWRVERDPMTTPARRGLVQPQLTLRSCSDAADAYQPARSAPTPGMRPAAAARRADVLLGAGQPTRTSRARSRAAAPSRTRSGSSVDEAGDGRRKGRRGRPARRAGRSTRPRTARGSPRRGWPPRGRPRPSTRGRRSAGPRRWRVRAEPGSAEVRGRVGDLALEGAARGRARRRRWRPRPPALGTRRPGGGSRVGGPCRRGAGRDEVAMPFIGLEVGDHQARGPRRRSHRWAGRGCRPRSGSPPGCGAGSTRGRWRRRAAPRCWSRPERSHTASTGP